MLGFASWCTEFCFKLETPGKRETLYPDRRHYAQRQDEEVRTEELRNKQSQRNPGKSPLKIALYVNLPIKRLLYKSYRPIPRWDSISRPIAPISSVAGGDDVTRPRRQGANQTYIIYKYRNCI
jgi:hypothetical protein